MKKIKSLLILCIIAISAFFIHANTPTKPPLTQLTIKGGYTTTTNDSNPLESTTPITVYYMEGSHLVVNVEEQQQWSVNLRIEDKFGAPVYTEFVSSNNTVIPVTYLNSDLYTVTFDVEDSEGGTGFYYTEFEK